MEKEIVDLLFDKKIRDGISRDSIIDNRNQKKEDKGLIIASLIAYVLKFKKKDFLLSDVKTLDFSEIKLKSLEQFRKKQTDSISKIRYYRFAAIASILVVVAIGAYWFGQNQVFSGVNKQCNVIEFNTPKGQQSEVTLPDGTFVALNYDSKLKYHISPNKKLQEVELNGEAFFKVTKNKSRTFKVRTKNMSVNVLGTEFNVRAYNNDLKAEATLLEGSIEINDIPNQDDVVVLNPGQKWTYNKVENKQTVVKVDTHVSTLWRNGEYYFEKVSFGDLAKTLERMYNVNIHFEDFSLANEVYSGSVYQNETIDNLFEIINLTVPITVKTMKNEIWISKK